MSEEYGNDFITLTDEEGNQLELEHLDTLEYNGATYMAFVERRSLPYRPPRNRLILDVSKWTRKTASKISNV
jgi:hypothetical protein